MKKRIRRRSFLRGLGVALSLPVLDVMLGPNGEALAEDGSATPLRYLTAYSHISLGGGSDRRIFDHYAPNTTGFDYDLTGRTATLPFEPVKEHVTILSGMAIPMKKDNGGVLPRAGIGDHFHGKPIQQQFAGTAIDAPAGSFGDFQDTLDVQLGRTLGADTPFARLHYNVSGFGGKGASPTFIRDGGRVTRESPQSSLQQAWRDLTGARPSADPVAEASRLLAFERRQSVLDLVHEDRTRMVSRVGAVDRRRLEQHFDHIRSLELKLGELAALPVSMCSMMPDPGPDPEVRDAPASSDGLTKKYSNEDLRASVVLDLIYMAFACDLTRVATISFINSGLWLEQLIGVAQTAHDLTHNGRDQSEKLGRLFGWMHGHQAELIARMADTPEGDGTMLDNVVFTSWHEGGHGRGPERDNDILSHSVENMCAIIAGGRAGGLVPGQHVEARGVHPGRVHVSAMRALGVTGGLGELGQDEFIPELFGE